MRVQLALAMALCAQSALAQEAGTVHGRVVQSGSPLPVHGAQVALDASPADGTPEHVVTSSVVGTFSIGEVPAGSYRLEIARPGYTTHNADITVGGGRVRHDAALAVESGAETLIDLSASVLDVTTRAALPGAVVTFDFWPAEPAAGDGVAASTTVVADDVGRALLPAQSVGYYRITIARGGWETYVHPEAPGVATLLDEGHDALALLKPVAKPLTVHVVGRDPAQFPALDDVPLAGAIVEITALELLVDRVVSAPRAELSSLDGSVVFTLPKLAPVRWQVQVKKLGYELFTTIVSPNVAGAFDDLDVTLALHEETQVRVVLQSPYADPVMIAGAYVFLEGVKGTHTEGVGRFVPAAVGPDGAVESLFERLVPGRYWIRASHVATLTPEQLGLPPTNGPIVGLPFAIQVALHPREAHVEIADMEAATVTLAMEPVSALVTGTLLGSDGLTDPFDSKARRLAPMPNVELTLRAFTTDGLLDPEHADYTATTDAEGRFAMEVPPARYGVVIEALTDYTGFRVMRSWRNVGDEHLSKPLQRAWPFAVPWPHETHHQWLHGAALAMSSGAQHDLGLEVHKQAITLGANILHAKNTLKTPASVAVFQDGGSFLTQYLGDIWMTKPEHTLTLAGPQTYTAQASRTPGVNQPTVVFEGVVPGDYTLTGDHPYFDIPSKTITVDPWAAPGVPPPAVYPLNTTHYVTPGYFHWLLMAADDDPGKTTNWWSWTSKVDASPIDGYQIVTCAWIPAASPEDQPKWAKVATLAGSFVSSALPEFEDMLFFGAQPVFGEHQILAYYDKVYGESVNGWAVFSPGDADNTTTCCPGTSGSLDCITQSPNYDTFWAYVGGAKNNVGPEKKPTAIPDTFEVEIRTFNVRDEEIVGLPVTVDEQTVESGEGQVVVLASLADLTSPTIASPQWTVSGQVQTSVLWTPAADPGTLRLQMRIIVMRAMVISGKVTTPDGAGIGGVPIVLKSPGGADYVPDPGDVISGADGSFEVGQLIPGATYLEVARESMIPVRKRVAPASAAEPDVSGLTLVLQPVPPPEVSELAIDRYGFFLPAVLKSGDATGLSPDNAAGSLTATWTTTLTPATYWVTRPTYEDADGAWEEETVTISDPIRSVWLVDKRFFRTPSLSAPPVAGDDAPVDELVPPSTTGATTQWLDDMIRGVSDLVEPGEYFNVLHQRGQAQGGDAVGGQLKLWELPAGTFEPWIVAFTHGGGVAFFDYADHRPAGRHALHGVHLPRWASFLVNLIGTMANLPEVDPSKWVPKGRYLPMPSFDAAIGLSQDGYLTYDYRLKVAWLEGQKNGGGGLLGTASRALGLILPAELGFKVDGAAKKISMTGTAVTSAENQTQFFGATRVDVPGAVPVGETPTKKVDRKVTGSLALSIIEQYGEGAFKDFRLKLTASATLGIITRYRLNKLLRRVPHVNAALAFLEAVAGLDVFWVFDFGIGGDMSSEFSLLVDEAPESGVPTGSPSLDAFGGKDSRLPIDLDAIFFKSATGLELAAWSDRLKVRGLLKLGAPNDVIVPLGGMKLVPNPESWWPPIVRLTGAFSIELSLMADTWGVGFAKQWQWDLKRFDVEFGTEPSFNLTPSGLVTTVIAPSTMPPGGGAPAGERLVTDLYPLTPVASAWSKDGSGLAYVQTEPMSGTSSLVAAIGAPGAWAEPVTVATTDGIVVGAAVAALKDGRWLAAWSDRAADDPSASPPTAVQWAVGDGSDGPWTDSGVVADVEATAHDLQLAALEGGAVLVFRVNAEGPESVVEAVRAAVLKDDAWSAPGEVLAPTPLRSVHLAAAPTGGSVDATLGVVTDDGKLDVLDLTDGQWGDWQPAATEAGGGVDLAFDDDGGLWIAAGGRDGGVVVLSRPAGAGKPVAAGPFVEVRAFDDRDTREIRLHAFTEAAGTSLLMAWLERGETDRLAAEYLSADGATLAGPLIIAPDAPGSLRALQLLPAEDAAHAAVLVVHRTHGTSSHLEAWRLDDTGTVTPASDGEAPPPVESDQPGTDVSAPLPPDSEGDCSCRTIGGPQPIRPGAWIVLLCLLLMGVTARRRATSRHGTSHLVIP